MKKGISLSETQLKNAIYKTIVNILKEERASDKPHRNALNIPKAPIENRAMLNTKRAYGKGLADGAKMAAQFMYSFMDKTICADFNDGVKAACRIYKYITGKNLNIHDVLGV